MQCDHKRPVHHFPALYGYTILATTLHPINASFNNRDMKLALLSAKIYCVVFTIRWNIYFLMPDCVFLHTGYIRPAPGASRVSHEPFQIYIYPRMV